MKQTPAQIRLNAYRAKAAKHNDRYFSDWRNHRPKLAHSSKKYGWGSDGGMWLDSHECAPGFRSIQKAHDLVRLSHTGWFTDSFDWGETAYGTVSVLRLGRFAYIVPGYSHSDWDNDWLDFSAAQRIPARDAWDECGRETGELSDAMHSMAYTADSIAQRFAEECREQSEKDQAEQRIEQCREEITDARETVRELIREIRAAGAMPPTICATIRKRLNEEWAMIQNLRESIRELTAHPYMIHEYR